MPLATKEAQREYQREWVANRRARFFSDKCCAWCKSTENLRLDHIDPKKKQRSFDHCIWSWSEERRDEELKKCQILCNDCHITKTNIDRDQGYILHGHKKRGYENGCRCDLCKKAQRDYMRQYRYSRRLKVGH